MVLPTSVVYEQKDYKLLLEEMAKKDKQIEDLHGKQKRIEKMAQNLVESLNRSVKFMEPINPTFFVDNIFEFQFTPVMDASADRRIRCRAVPISENHSI